MKKKIFTLCGALVLSFAALSAASPKALYNCAAAERECKAGCPCALFECYPSQGYSICSCPIICWEES